MGQGVVCGLARKEALRQRGAVLGDPQTSKRRNLHQIQDDGEDRRSGQRTGHDPGRQRRHCNSGDGQCRGDQDIGDRRNDEPEARTRSPQMPAFTIGVDRRLVPEHDDDKGQRPSAHQSRTPAYASRKSGRRAKDQHANAIMTPAIVKLPMRHAFGIGDGRTLSVVNAMARKSPAIMISTISNGVRIACPVMIRPTPGTAPSRLLGDRVQRIGLDALERSRDLP